MVSSPARTVEQYLAELPEDRRAALEVVRTVILENLPAGFEEGMQYGMIGYYVPLSRYPKTYNGQALTIAGLASQKSYMAVYLMSVYGHRDTRRWFEKAYRESGKKLDMGKSCVRFRSMNDLPLEVVGQAIAKVSVDSYLAHYEASARGTRKATTKGMKKAKAKAKTQPTRANARKKVEASARTRPAAGRATAAKKGKSPGRRAGRK